jgi:hypothetical protein
MNSLPVEQQACGISRKVLVEWLDKPARTATRAGTLRCRRHAYHRVTNPTLRLDDAKCEITKFAAPPGAAMPNKLILKQRGKDKPYRTAEQLKALGRVAQLTRIYRDQYPK